MNKKSSLGFTPIDPTVAATLAIYQKYFDNQLDLTCEFFKKAFGINNRRINYLVPLLDSINTAGKSIDMLTKKGLLTESFIVARAFIERMVNFSYLLVCDQDEFDNYMDYSKQKIFRSIVTKQQTFKHIGRDFTIPDSLTIPSDIKMALQKFTSKKGREQTRWTEVGLDERISYIEEKIPEAKKTILPIFRTAKTYIYEDASEAIHGTLYGALFHTGLLYYTKSKEEGENYLNGLRMNIYMLLGILTGEFLSLINTQVQIKNLLKQSDSNFNILCALQKEQNNE